MIGMIPVGWTACPSCGAYDPPSAKHCGKCGQPKGKSKDEPSLERVFEDAENVSSERELQQDACKWLLLNGAGGIVWSGMHKATTVLSGTADFVFCWRGHYVAAEAKIKNNQPRQNQLDFLESAKRADGISFVFRSVDELRAKLQAL